ncbi:MAG TPA: hypothetical protein VH661_01370, partial [Candidatus Dormibacteraeota bacterium]|nr:hypothetical protein [Candidatus Dormibacteraeota bacterium]
MRALRLAAASLPVLTGFTLAGAVARVGPVAAGCAQASSAHHAALVVEHGNGAVTKACVSFSGTQVTGEQLLNLSQVPYKTVDFGSYGKAVCQIQGEPATYPSNCFSTSYWAMFVSRGGGAWQTSNLGISSQTFRDGDAEGFRYEGQSDSFVPPSPAGVCPAPVAATPPPVSSATSIRRATAAGVPSTTAGRASPSLPAAAAAAGSHTTGQPSPNGTTGASTASASAGAGIAASSTTPLARPPFLSSSVWAALALAAL